MEEKFRSHVIQRDKTENSCYQRCLFEANVPVKTGGTWDMGTYIQYKKQQMMLSQ